MNNIYLIGMPGSGKTTLGKQISSDFNLPFIDLDYYLVEKERHTIEDIFNTRGEKYFRIAETKYLKEVSKKENTIVSTGGGVVLFDENIEIMKDSGIIIFINTPPECILKNSTLTGRPLLHDKNKIFTLYEERFDKYKKAADFMVDNLSDIQQAKSEITDILNFVL